MPKRFIKVLAISIALTFFSAPTSIAGNQKPKPAYPVVTLSVLGLKENLHPSQGAILLFVGTPKDRCGLLGSDGSSKSVTMDFKGSSEFRFTAPLVSGNYNYEAQCRLSGSFAFKIVVGPWVTGIGVSIPPFMTGQPCLTQGEVTELFSGDKGICLTTTKGLKTTVIWRAITVKPSTPCLVEGQKIPIFSNETYFLCYSNMGSSDFFFRKYTP